MKYRLELLALKALFSLLSRQSPEGRLTWGRRLGRYWYALDGKHRELAIANIAAALDYDREQAAATARRVFENIALNVAEFAAFGQEGMVEESVGVEGAEHLEKALARGKGAFLVSGHIGNWELTGAALSRCFPMSVVARSMKNPLSEKLIADQRVRGGMQVIGHRNSTRPILKKLAAGEVITVLLDQNTSYREAVFVPFLGRPAAVNFGVALLAAKSGAAVLPGFSVREEGLRHRAIIGPPFDLVRLDDRQEEIGVNTARFTAALEDHIRRHPDQWFWVHNRWKNQPRSGQKVYQP